MASKCPILLAYCLYIIGFVLGAVGFGTGFWFVAEGENRLFIRLGLWEACFNGYEHTSDYIGKAYYGCWWIFHKEYSYIRNWIMPDWFIACQTLMTFAILFMFITIAVFPLAMRDRENVKMLNINSLLVFATAVCLTIPIVVFGVMVGVDRTWMPRPDIDKLGWSYGLVVVSGFLTWFCFICLNVYTSMRKWELLQDEDSAANKQMMPGVPKI